MTTDTYMPKLWVQYDAMHQHYHPLLTYFVRFELLESYAYKLNIHTNLFHFLSKYLVEKNEPPKCHAYDFDKNEAWWYIYHYKDDVTFIRMISSVTRMIAGWCQLYHRPAEAVACVYLAQVLDTDSFHGRANSTLLGSKKRHNNKRK